MPADRVDDRDVLLAKAPAEVLHLSYAGVNMIVVHALGDADGQGFHVTPRHAPVGVQALVHDNEAAGLVVEPAIVHREESADIDHRIFFRRHCGGIGQSTDLIDDLANGLVRKPLLALLDEMRVLGNTRHVVHEHDAVPVTPGAQLLEVGHRDWLAAGHVDAGSHADVRDLLRADFLDERIELTDVEIALERMIRFGIVGFIDNRIDEGRAGEFLVQPRGSEIHVAGHKVTRFDQALAEDVLGAAALVSRYCIPVAVEFLDCVAQAIEVAAARIGFVAHHDA